MVCSTRPRWSSSCAVGGWSASATKVRSKTSHPLRSVIARTEKALGQTSGASNRRPLGEQHSLGANQRELPLCPRSKSKPRRAGKTL
jgi:hypothetical protein